ncbi:MAG: AI-2E family transporter [Spirulina sp.]
MLPYSIIVEQLIRVFNSIEVLQEVKFIDWIYLIIVIFLLLALWQFRQIVLLVFFAVVLAVGLNSLVRAIVNRLKVSRGIAALLTIILLFTVLAVFVGIVLPPFLAQFQQLLTVLPAEFEDLAQRVEAIVADPPPWLPNPDIDLLPDYSQLIQQGGSIVQTLFGNFFSFFSGSLAVILQVLLVLLLTLMMLAEPQVYRNLAVRVFPAFYRPRADEILARCEVNLLSWGRGAIIDSSVIGISSGIGLTLLGVPFAYANALLAGGLNFIPNIGPTLSIFFPVLLALNDSPQKAILVVVLYVVVQNVDAYIISPIVMKEQVSLIPAVTLVSQLFFTTFLGPLGLALALPLTVISKTWIEEAWLSDVLDRWQRTEPETAQLAAANRANVVLETRESSS